MVSRIMGRDIHRFDVVDSTNNTAKKLAEEGALEGTAILAKEQRAGKGRLKREWASPKGGLWLSIILKPEIEPQEAPKVTLMAGWAVARVITRVGRTSSLNVKIKWPNDVLIDGKKVAGILTEMRCGENHINYIILGIGVNVNFDLNQLPEDLRDSATTLKHELGMDTNLEEFLFDLLKELDDVYMLLISNRSGEILDAVRELSDTLGRKVSIKTLNEDVEGKAVNIDETGALIVETDEGVKKRIVAGDCLHLSGEK